MLYFHLWYILLYIWFQKGKMYIKMLEEEDFFTTKMMISEICNDSYSPETCVEQM